LAIQLSEKISAFPIRHGRASFAMELRKLLWQEKFSCLAFALPKSLQEDALEGVQLLPEVHALVIRVDGEVRAYLPFDPADAYVEGLRQAAQKRIPISFVEGNELLEGPFLQPLPDAYLLHSLGTEGYFNLARKIIFEQRDDDRLKSRVETAFQELNCLQEKQDKILFLCDFPILIQLQNKFHEQTVSDKTRVNPGAPTHANFGTTNKNSDQTVAVEIFPIKNRHLYFALGELPFYAGAMEKERQDPLAIPMDYLELIKRIFIETRNHFLPDKTDANAVSIKKIQVALQFLRNLTVQQHRLTPDLMDIISAAKGVFGNAFAAKVLEAARYYPFVNTSLVAQTPLEIGRSHIHLPGEDEPVEAFNLFEDEPKVWKTIHLKPVPNRDEQKKYRYAWDSKGMCSHAPEDVRIEGFNQAIRKRALDLDQQAFSHSEKLTSSLKDGIDIRETLRNWSTGGIYVKEVPPSKGRVDTVVILFDTENDVRYPSHTTWYAEHEEESTLTFYGTEPMTKLIGPGIAEAEYGGLSLLFPPRPIGNVFSLPSKEFGFQNLAEQLVYGALLNSKERSVTIVSHRKPGLRLKRLAAQFGRRLVWIPLTAFSSETLRRLRKFHILNGKHVRAWASRYIPE